MDATRPQRGLDLLGTFLSLPKRNLNQHSSKGGGMSASMPRLLLKTHRNITRKRTFSKRRRSEWIQHLNRGLAGRGANARSRQDRYSPNACTCSLQVNGRMCLYFFQVRGLNSCHTCGWCPNVSMLAIPYGGIGVPQRRASSRCFVQGTRACWGEEAATWCRG